MNKKKWFVLVGFLLLLAGLPTGAYLVTQRTSLFTQASPEETPREIKITNISDNSFTVSFITPDKAVVGYVGYGETKKLGNSSSDDRDSANQQARFTHHITLKNLSPSTTYYFKIGSGRGTYDNNGSPYQVTTAPTTSDPPPVADSAFGKIKTSLGSAPSEALIYLTFAGGTPLSSYTRETGNWLITLNNARTSDLSTYLQPQNTGTFDVLVKAGQDGTSSGKADLGNRSPVPDITLGKTFSFVASNYPIPTTTPSFSLAPVENATESKIPLEIKDFSGEKSLQLRIKTPTVTPTLPVAGSVETTLIIIATGLVVILIGLFGAVLL